jgi:hypothetical protein
MEGLSPRQTPVDNTLSKIGAIETAFRYKVLVDQEGIKGQVKDNPQNDFNPSSIPGTWRCFWSF